MTAHDGPGSVVGDARKRLVEGFDQLDSRTAEVARLRHDLAAARATIARVEALHVPDADGQWCQDDGFSWPCPTARALSSPESPVSTRSEGVDVEAVVGRVLADHGFEWSDGLRELCCDCGWAMDGYIGYEDGLAERDPEKHGNGREIAVVIRHRAHVASEVVAALSAPVPGFGNERPAAEEAAGSSSNDAHTAPVPGVAAERVAAVAPIDRMGRAARVRFNADAERHWDTEEHVTIDARGEVVGWVDHPGCYFCGVLSGRVAKARDRAAALTSEQSAALAGTDEAGQS